MNREEAKALLPIITAFADGKEVQVFSEKSNKWEHVEFPTFGGSKYRIKPEPLECWIVINRDGDSAMHRSKVNADKHAQGYFSPCTIHHMREVED